jgi:CubicO group peptidase (beta-lactamase class C family)
MTIKNFQKLKDRMNEFINDGLFQGIEWMIGQSGSVYKDSVGYMDIKTKQPIVDQPIYRIWSMTKPIISVSIMQLIEKKYLRLDEELKNIIPLFKYLKVMKDSTGDIEDVTNLNTEPTIFDLLNHTAGFSYHFLGDPVGVAYDKVNFLKPANTILEEEIEKLANIPLLFQPKQRWRYSVAIDILGRVIEVVTRQSLRSYLRENIFDPLEMSDTDFYVPQKKQDRVMTSYCYDIEKNTLLDWEGENYENQSISNFSYPLNEPDRFSRGGHGLYSSSNDYFNFSKMLLTGKNQAGKNIIELDSIRFMTTNRISEKLLPLEIKHIDDQESLNFFEPYSFGLGFRIKRNIKSDNNSNPGEFGWGGAASTFFLVDPKENLAAVIMTQVLNGNYYHKDLDFINFIY